MLRCPKSLRRLALLGLAVCALLPTLAAAQARPNEDLLRQAREAFGRKDKNRLAALRASALEQRDPLAPWVDYWELTARLTDARAEEVEAFYGRWPGSYVEDRLRNDWLLETGKRRDWAAFARDLPRFRMNDDREVSCYALVLQQQSGKVDVDAARRAWLAQRDPGDGCLLMAQTFLDARLFDANDIWRQVRHATEYGRVKSARAAAAILGDAASRPLGEALDNPARYLALKASALGHLRAEISSIALARIAANDPDRAAQLLADRWGEVLGPEHGAWAWAMVAKQGALALRPEALDWTRKAWQSLGKRHGDHPDWSPETLAWLARASLRLAPAPERWQLVLRSVDAMEPGFREDATWVYWRARALQGLAKAGTDGDAQRAEAQQLLARLSTQLSFYGQLAAEDLGAPQPLPPRPAALTAPEREAARAHAGLQRALLAIAIGLRSEGVREWNFSLLGMGDRELLAAAQWACEREVWDRCINTSDRSKAEIDMEQRFPMPMRADVLARTREIGLDPAYVYGLIRQESRFIMDARSAVGASGLMQVMPATAKWTAKKIGMGDFRPEMITERDTNLRIGSAYLKLVLDDLGGSQAMAAAAYNAGPGRPRRWREGPTLEPAIWAENVPIHETRDYVKKVLSNATYYAGLLAGKPAALKARLGTSIGPRAAGAPAADSELP
ncbi:lytic transglycosylase domain-containing protein [Ideonella alba]|uniref:Lytic transglycosylase domain-containing protein n=1 Tax=Ideonella alba TaxID=2824118 RepID=A0A940YHH4_9BURK|nr:lytic transglycosylase domain-containing protein [Ideonella alba]MBQ0929999.1 lytic transglycosylase domain-containing protein [Ideonella alba]